VFTHHTSAIPSLAEVLEAALECLRDRRASVGYAWRMHASAYMEFSEELRSTLSARSDAVGLVLVGSTADPGRRDEWSDHDFFVITEDDAQEAMRNDLRWLPASDTIAISVRETAHGLKVVYDDGHVLEFAVFSLAELAETTANSYEVALDKGGVAEAMLAVAAKPKASATHDDERDLKLFLTLILIGVGRARRGEVLVGGQFVRSYALHHLLPVLTHRLPSDEKHRLDDLDVFRRLEFVFPELGARRGAAGHRRKRTRPARRCPGGQDPAGLDFTRSRITTGMSRLVLAL
jgi:hypothetical protein